MDVAQHPIGGTVCRPNPALRADRRRKALSPFRQPPRDGIWNDQFDTRFCLTQRFCLTPVENRVQTVPAELQRRDAPSQEPNSESASRYFTMSLRDLRGRMRTTFRAGLALNIIS